MKLKSHFTTAIVVCYILIFIGFIAFKRSTIDLQSIDFVLSPKNRTINVCKAHSEKYTDESLINGFKNVSISNNFEDFTEFVQIIINRHELACETLMRKVVVDDLKGVRFIRYLRNNFIVYDGFFYGQREYCLEPYEISLGEIRMNGIFCEPNYTLLYALNFLFVIIATIFLIIPLWIYFMIPAIRSEFHGKICIAQLIIQIIMVIVYPLSEYWYYYDHLLGSIMLICVMLATYSVNVCTSMMCYDIFMSLRNFNTPDIARQPYWKFFLKLVGIVYIVIFFICAFVYGFIGAITFVRTTVATIAFIFQLNFLINIVLLIMTYKKIRDLSRTPEIPNNQEFKSEEERFFLYIRLFVIFSVMWSVEVLSQLNPSFTRYEEKIVADIIKIISSLIIAQSLLINPKVRALLFEKYISLKDHIEDQSVATEMNYN